MKNIILSMFLLVLLVGTASASVMTTHSYKDNDMKVEFRTLGTFYQGDATLKSHSSIDKILTFGFGKEEVVMYYDFNWNNLLKDGLGEVTFTNERTGKEIQKDYYFVEWVVRNVSVNDYGWVDVGKNLNSSTNYEYQVIGNHLEEKGSWENYVGNDIPKGNTRIGIKTYVGMTDYMDAKWTISGDKILKHAVWVSTLEANMISFWTMNYSSGPINDSLGNATGTNNGADYGAVGIINDSLDFEFDDSDFVTVGDNAIFNFTGTTPFSVSAWVSREEQHGNDMIFSKDKDPTQQYTLGMSTLNKALIGINGIDVLFNTTIQIDVLTHIVYIIDSQWVTVWVNGTLDGNFTRVSIQAGTDTTGMIGARAHSGAPDYFDGEIDEISVWNRSLTASEVTNLYSGGYGCTYQRCVSKNPEVTLNSPVVAFNTTSQTIGFNGSSVSINGIVNVSLKIDGIINETNSSGINNTDYLFSKILDYGEHNWTYESCNSFGCTTPTIRNLNITNFAIISENFTASLLEGTSSVFTISIETNGTGITIGNLSYNNTENIGSITQTGNNFTINKTITAPITSGNINISFFWNITRTDGTLITRPPANQTILNLNIDDCSTNTNVLYNFTNVGEEDQALISASNVTSQVDLLILDVGRTNEIANFSKEYTTTNPFGVCFNSTMGAIEEYVADVQIKYFGDIHEREFYHIQNSSITTDDFPTNITLFDLLNSSSTSFEITFKDASFLPVADALIQIQRKYIEEGLFKVVEIPKTDTEGKTIGHFVLQDIIYTIIVVKNGETLGTFNDVRVVCQNPTLEECIIPLNAVTTTIQPEDFTQLDDFTFTLDYNTTSREVKSIYTIPSSSVATVLLNVTLSDALGNTTVCSDSLTSSAGTLQCNVPSSFGNTSVKVELLKDNVIQGSGIIYLTPKPSDTFGGNLVFIGIFLYMTLIGIALSSSPMITGFFLIIGAILGVSLNFVSGFGFIGAGATILWLIIAIIITLVKGQSRS